MRKFAVAAIGLALAGPAAAQGLGDVGRLLQQQIQPRQQPDPRQQDERDRAIYEQGRRDSEDARRQGERRHDAERGDYRQGDGRRTDERRRDIRRSDDPDGYRNDEDRRRGDGEQRIRPRQ